MKKLPCPHCQAPEIPGLTKLTLGPGRTIACPKCGGAISVPWTTLLLLLPFMGAMGIARTSSSLPLKAIVWVLMLGVVVVILQFFVPLQARDARVGRK